MVDMLRAADFPAAVVDSELNITIWNAAISSATRTQLDLAQRPVVPFASLPFVGEEAREAAIAVLKKVLSGDARDRGVGADGEPPPPHTLSSSPLYLKLWTDRGEVALSMTASMIGPEHEAQRPVALYGQVLDHDVIAGLRRWKGGDGFTHESGRTGSGSGSGSGGGGGGGCGSGGGSVVRERSGGGESGDQMSRRRVSRGSRGGTGTGTGTGTSTGTGSVRAGSDSDDASTWCSSTVDSRSTCSKDSESDTATELRGGFTSGMKTNPRARKQFRKVIVNVIVNVIVVVRNCKSLNYFNVLNLVRPVADLRCRPTSLTSPPVLASIVTATDRSNGWHAPCVGCRGRTW